ncbi:hypothetical protein [Azohydromonas aeria]|uniref:hypothetical protein n=1 Tax=Azohydromonas aeria TaxID=2590212 RepID=UPI0012F7A39B|nr:hypothetical protein [Azohydromonas aeria]
MLLRRRRRYGTLSRIILICNQDAGPVQDRAAVAARRRHGFLRSAASGASDAAGIPGAEFPDAASTGIPVKGIGLNGLLHRQADFRAPMATANHSPVSLEGTNLTSKTEFHVTGIPVSDTLSVTSPLQDEKASRGQCIQGDLDPAQHMPVDAGNFDLPHPAWPCDQRTSTVPGRLIHESAAMSSPHQQITVGYLVYLF